MTLASVAYITAGILLKQWHQHIQERFTRLYPQSICPSYTPQTPLNSTNPAYNDRSYSSQNLIGGMIAMRTSIQKECFRVYKSLQHIGKNTNDPFIQQMIDEVVECIESICECEQEKSHPVDWEWLFQQEQESDK